jgi:hypothetical protein
MSGRRINPNRVKIHRNYTARGLADSLGVHKNTIRHWQRNGLVPIDNQRPYLFHGAAVRAFLAEWNKRRNALLLSVPRAATTDRHVSSVRSIYGYIRQSSCPLQHLQNNHASPCAPGGNSLGFASIAGPNHGSTATI